MSWAYSEQHLVQEPAANWMFAQGWKPVFAFDAEDFGPNSLLGRAGKSETILFRSVRKALKRINAEWITDNQIEEAINTISEVQRGKTLLQQNFEAYEFVREGVPVSDADYEEGAGEKRRAMLIDFDHPENNEFLAVREMWVTAPGVSKRPDLIGFVNGLPLLFMEFKKPSCKARDGYDHNYKDYLATIPDLFRFNALCVFSAGNETNYGALGSDWEFFGEWKRHAEDDEAEVSLKKLIDGICQKEKFLDIVENFVMFDRNDGKMFKIIARNHQYLGVNRAFESYLKRDENHGKLGVFWHTQGSGKSYSMVFLARKILRKTGGSPTFLIVTDREELNKQISETFASCGCLGAAQPETCMPGSGEALAKRLKGNDSFLFTLIQKFNSSTWTPLHPDHEVIIFSDEAHRTNNGLLADNMLRFLPDSCRIGFTGTPLQKGDMTEQQFGSYVSVYDFKRAVEDHATVPLFYDTKVNQLGLNVPGLNDELIEAIELEDLAPEDRKRINDEIKSKIMLYMAPERIAVVAKDFVRDYTAKWKSGKAMVVSVNKVAAYRTFTAVQEEWAKYLAQLEEILENPRKSARKTAAQLDELAEKIAWMRETKMELVISKQQGDKETFEKNGIDIIPYWERTKNVELEKDFKKSDNPFRVAFVCAMWLTGFDVPSLGTLYLDKPLKAHSLMQAIARANRVFEGKHNGVIVDYIGLIDYLSKALADFTGNMAGEGKTSPLPPVEEMLEHYEECISTAAMLLKENGFNLSYLVGASDEDKPLKLKEAANAVSNPDNVARAFVAVARKIDEIGRFIDASALSDTIRAKRDAIREIRSFIEHHREIERNDIGDLIIELQRIVGEHIVDATNKVGNKCDDISIDLSKIDYSRIAKKIDAYKYKKLLLKQLAESAEQIIAKMIAQNPASQNYQDELQKIIDEYNLAHEKAAIEDALQKLLKLIEKVGEEEHRYIAEGLQDPQQLAVYEILKSGKELSARDLKEVKAVAVELLAELRKIIAETPNWRYLMEGKAKVRIVIKNVLFANLPEGIRSLEEQKDFEEKVYNYFYQLPDVA